MYTNMCTTLLPLPPPLSQVFSKELDVQLATVLGDLDADDDEEEEEGGVGGGGGRGSRSSSTRRRASSALAVDPGIVSSELVESSHRTSCS